MFLWPCETRLRTLISLRTYIVSLSIYGETEQAELWLPRE